MDFQGQPFGYMPLNFLLISEHVTKVHVCLECGNIANHSFRTSDNKDLVSLGEKNNYKPL